MSLDWKGHDSSGRETLYVLAWSRVKVNKWKERALFQSQASSHSPKGLDH